MTKQRDGFHNATIQISRSAWAALCADAEEKGDSVTRLVNEILHKHYKIPLNKIPAPKPPGRRPKK